MSELPKPTDDIRQWLRGSLLTGSQGEQIIAELDALEAENAALREDKERLVKLLEYLAFHVGPVPLRETTADILREHRLRDRMVLAAKAAIDAAKGGSSE